MTSNTALWDKLGKTDPAHTKGFTRSGGFKGTAIKPMWSYRRMTEEFGPCGQGWGICKPSFDVVPVGESTMVYCTVSVWYEKPDQLVFGVGGDMVAGKRGNHSMVDDEAFKKAFTDAITNALKLIGVGADVHMGMFDDSKYVNAVAHEFQEEAEVKAKSSAQLKREGEWERVSKEIADAMNDVRTFGQFESLKESYRKEAKQKGWNEAFMYQLRDLFASYEDDVQKRVDAENDGVVDEVVRQTGGKVVDERVIRDSSGRELSELEAV